MTHSAKQRSCTIEEYKQFLASAPDAALLISEQGSILFVNEEAARLLGYSETELVDAYLSLIIPERVGAVHEQYRKHYMNQPWQRPMSDSHDLTIRHKDGREIPVIISIAPLQVENEPFVIAFVRDISERKRMEDSLQQAHEAMEQQVIERTADLHRANEALRSEIADRMRAEAELRQLTDQLAQREEQLVQELRALLNLSTANTSPITAESFGLLPLSESLHETFQELTRQYSHLLDLALEEKSFKVDHHLGEALRALAHRLGFLGADPHDVVLLHSEALKQKSVSESYFKIRAYFDEGRLIVLQLMGYLVAYYRSHSIHLVRTDDTAKSANSPTKHDYVAQSVRED
jgi:PAS domain S-box-containing protein